MANTESTKQQAPPDPQPGTHRADQVIDQVLGTLKHLARTGRRGFDCSDRHLQMLQRWGTARTADPESLEDIRHDLGDCRRCRLATGRTNIVFGEGNPGARLVFVGEGPGFEEDRQARPFVGKAGRLLTKIIAAMGLQREQVYICNIIKCRPPENRNPQDDEIESCAPFVRRQLRAIAPQFVCTLGTFASQTLLQTSQPISRLRGRFHQVMGLQVLPTYHPAYLLRNPERKRDVWQDMQLLMKAMDLPLPQKKKAKS